MKFGQILMFLCITAISVNAQQGGLSGIKGKITTSDGHDAPYVSVKLVGKSIGATSNEKGEYEIVKVKPGKYIIKVSAIGLTSEEKVIEVTESPLTGIDFVLNEDLGRLEEVTISARAGGYKADRPSSTLRLDEPLLEIPQNVQIVTGSALADQQVISMSDGVLRNVSGAVRKEHWGDLYTNVMMRGSQVQAFRNGFNVVGSSWGPLTEDMSFVDHIEFVKGPAGFMLANGDPAGLYNVVTKKPTGQTKGEFSMTLGSFNLYRSALDVDGKLTPDGRLLYRFNVAGQNKKSHRPNEFNNRYTLAPVLSYQLDNQTKLTAEYTYQYARMSDVGSYYVFSNEGYGSLPVSATSLPAGLPPTKIKDHSGFLSLEHQMNKQWKVTGQVAYLKYLQRGTSLWPSDINADGTLVRKVDIWDADSEMTLGQVFLNGSLKTGSVDHRILGGLDLGSKEYMADWDQSDQLDYSGKPFDFKNPDYGYPEGGYPRFNRTMTLGERAVAAGGLMDQRYSGIYVQDELGFMENRIRLTLAGRYSRVSQSQYGGEEQSSKKFTPRIGLSGSITKDFTAYALFDEAFIPQSGKLSDGGKIKPVTGNNMELGLKKDWFDGKWNTTLAAYRIVKKHELAAVPAAEPDEFLSVELGEKIAQGLEFDLRGEVAEGLNAVVNYAYTNTEITKLDARVTEYKVGDPVPGFAKHTLNAWLGYKIQDGVLKGAGVSGGFTYLADRAGSTYSAANPERNLPDYFRVDGGLFYESGKIRLTANAFNILDKYLFSGAYYEKYFESSPGVYSWQTEAPRNFRLSLAYQF